MVCVKPFKGIRYNLEKTLLKQVIAPPYDVIDEGMRETLIGKSPYNIVQIDLPVGGDNRYRIAGELYRKWREDKILIKDPSPAFYVYEQEYEYGGKNYVRTGFIGLLKIEELGKGSVFPHEKTLPGPKQDRFELMKATNANLSQIFGLYLDSENKLERIFSLAKKNMASASAVDVYGVKNSIWVVDDPESIEKIINFMKDKAVYIADGHHRYETAINFRNYMREKNPTGKGEEGYEYVMMMFVNFYDEGLKIFPTHRVVDLPEGFNYSEFMGRLEEEFSITELTEDKKWRFMDVPGEIRMLLVTRDSYFGLRVKDSVLDRYDPVFRRIDPYILQESVLKPLLEFTDEKLLKKQGICFVQTEEEIRELLASGNRIAFMLNGIDIEVVREVSESGLVMPQKSTYFYPKLQTGLVINDL
ncbi:MAG: DUF1015 domain-containing protein [Calditerrivibrio sp.]|nr:DUF1015 domain-containing protein [Calditerrivibrio sp.]